MIAHYNEAGLLIAAISFWLGMSRLAGLSHVKQLSMNSHICEGY